MPLFEVAIVQKPTANEAKDGVSETMILPPTPVLAKDENSAAILASQQVKDKGRPELWEVLVRPFPAKKITL